MESAVLHDDRVRSDVRNRACHQLTLGRLLPGHVVAFARPSTQIEEDPRTLKQTQKSSRPPETRTPSARGRSSRPTTTAPVVDFTFLRKAIGQNGTREKITIDKSGANTAAIECYNAEHEAGIEIRQVEYPNNILEQDHRATKRQVRPMLGFKSFLSAAVTLAGIKLMHMLPEGPIAGARPIASATAVLFAGGMS